MQVLISVLEGKLGTNRKSCRYLIGVLRGIFEHIIAMRKKLTKHTQDKSMLISHSESSFCFSRLTIFLYFPVSILKKVCFFGIVEKLYRYL